MLREGVPTVLDTIEDAGINTAILTTNYHHGRFLCPKTSRFETIRKSAACFEPQQNAYGALKPLVHEDLVEANLLENVREACEKRGLDFHAWHVMLHNSSLGESHPEYCAKNAWGDVHYFSLCPSYPAVRTYAKALLSDMITTVQPTRVCLESATFLTAFHGEHHEVANVDIGSTGRWLLSMCFCPGCMQRAREAGVDAKAALETVRRLLLHICKKDVGCEHDEKASIACYLLEYPELYHYERFRFSVVSSLAEELHCITRKAGVGLDFIPGAFTFTTNQNFLEGCSYTQLADAVDRFLLLAYGQTPQAVRHCVRTALALVPNKELAVALNMRYGSVSSQEDLLARIHVLREEGVRAFNFYNYGVFNEERFSWLKAACALL